MNSIRPFTAKILSEALSFLQNGSVVVIPTETVYGLAADCWNEGAIERIFAIKKRPADNPLILHVDGIDMAKQYGLWTPLAESLASHFWPGPLTLILEARPAVFKPDGPLPKSVTAGQSTVAVRCPALPLLRTLITHLGRPLAAPSANISGRISPTTPQMVFDQIGQDVPLILAAGACRHGLESTIVDARGQNIRQNPDQNTDQAARILRLGSLPASALAAVVTLAEGSPAGKHQTPHTSTAPSPTVPGGKYRHYAPQTPMRIHVKSVAAHEVLVHFGPNPFLAKTAGHVLNLSPSGDLSEAAHALYSTLWQADTIAQSTEKITGIAVAPIPATGLGHTLNERLAKAAGIAYD